MVALVAAATLASVNDAAGQPRSQPAAPRQPELSEPQLKLRDERLLKKYVWSTLGPAGMMNAGLLAGADQWRHRPEQWRRDGMGYVQRFASNYAASAIGGTTKYTIAHLFEQDPSFEHCRCRGFMRRVGHAATAPFTATDARGRRVFSIATVGGIAAENVIPAATWYPEPSDAGQGVYRASLGVVTKIAVDVVREFLPEPR